MLFTPSIIKTIHFKFIEGGNHYTASIDQREVDTRIAQIHATINDSLYSSGINSGMSENLIMELVNIFAWDIDFALDIRKGDQFTLIFERVYLDGGYLRDGNILAASFTNQGNNHTAIMFRDDDGSRHYFTPDGKSLKKAFLRSPVDFRRISSTFQKERFHPVYGKKRPHKGVDYAAKTGTTIKASGDGTVMFKGRKGGYGRTIILQHGHRYQTLYAHMSGYKRGIKTGQKVRQGQTIGFVGRSGVVTGPHLHYEFRVNGQHKNPLRVKFPDSSPIEAKYHKAFSATATHYSSLLDLVSNQQIALN
jgi:murein DD-endopeptidase MepM/ murein hydrolase activator NlpD